jgi:hypothetical protein
MFARIEDVDQLMRRLNLQAHSADAKATKALLVKDAAISTSILTTASELVTASVPFIGDRGSPPSAQTSPPEHSISSSRDDEMTTLASKLETHPSKTTCLKIKEGTEILVDVTQAFSEWSTLSKCAPSHRENVCKTTQELLSSLQNDIQNQQKMLKLSFTSGCFPLSMSRQFHSLLSCC